MDKNKWMKKALEEIDFINRYNSLLEKYSLNVIPMDQICNGYDVGFVKEIMEDTGYEVKFDKRERFFYTRKEKINDYIFNTHFDLKYGIVEMIWNIKYGDTYIVGSPINWFSDRYFDQPYLKGIVFSDPFQLYEIFEVLYKMYEDFKMAFLEATRQENS